MWAGLGSWLPATRNKKKRNDKSFQLSSKVTLEIHFHIWKLDLGQQKVNLPHPEKSILAVLISQNLRL